MLHQRGYAKMFAIFKDDELIEGLAPFNRIEPLNKTAEIGYWLTNRAGSSGAAGIDSSLRLSSGRNLGHAS